MGYQRRVHGELNLNLKMAAHLIKAVSLLLICRLSAASEADS